MMEEIKRDIKDIKEDIGEIKVDLKYHIKRTDLLEKEVKPVSKFINFLKWGIIAAGLTLTALNLKKALAHEVRPIEGILKKIRKVVPCEVSVHSHWRSKDGNKKIGGSKRSLHLDGRAMDISAIKCLSHAALAKIAHKYATVIIYNSHVHIDEREPKRCYVKTSYGYRFCKKHEK